jgi:hypothetical protein
LTIRTSVLYRARGLPVKKVWRDGSDFCQRFTGEVAVVGDTIAGAWRKSDDGSTWQHDLDLTHRRVK